MELEGHRTVGPLLAALCGHPDVFWEVNLQIAQYHQKMHVADITPSLYVGESGDLLVVPSRDVAVLYSGKRQQSWSERLFFVPPLSLYAPCIDWPMAREMLDRHQQAGVQGRVLTYDIVHDRAVATTASPDPEGSTYESALRMGYIHIDYPSEQSRGLLAFFGRE